MQEGKRNGKAEKGKDNRRLGTMTSFFNFSQRFPELQKDEHIIKIREAMKLTKTSNKSVREEITCIKNVIRMY